MSSAGEVGDPTECSANRRPTPIEIPIPPSRTVLIPAAPSRGTQNRDVEFAEVVWAFFKSRLPD